MCLRSIAVYLSKNHLCVDGHFISAAGHRYKIVTLPQRQKVVIKSQNELVTEGAALVTSAVAEKDELGTERTETPCAA